MLSKPILFVATANPAASREFYESRLGLTFVSDSPFALVFDVGGVELRVQKVEVVGEVRHTVLGWSVGDIAKVVRALTFKGVEFESFDQLEQDELRIWNAPGGAKVAWFRDPDSNTLSITEHRG